MRKQVITTATAILLGVAASATGPIPFVAGIGGALAAETGAKTMPDSSVNPPPIPAPVFDFVGPNRDHDWCYLPSSPCDNEHRVTN
jgi:hypothetical protein